MESKGFSEWNEKIRPVLREREPRSRQSRAADSGILEDCDRGASSGRTTQLFQSSKLFSLVLALSLWYHP